MVVQSVAFVQPDHAFIEIGGPDKHVELQRRSLWPNEFATSSNNDVS